MIYGENIDDHETSVDEKLLEEYKVILSEKGFKVAIQLGFGKPNKVIPEIINEGNFDVLVMGTHGHGIQRFTFGTTVDKLRHKISIPLFIVKN
jgi:manganese transport protein